MKTIETLDDVIDMTHKIRDEVIPISGNQYYKYILDSIEIIASEVNEIKERLIK